MVSNQHKQQGMTFIGIVIMFLFIGFLVLAVLRVFPLYYENMGAQKSLEAIVEDFRSNPTMQVSDIRKKLSIRLETQDVRNLKAQNIIIKPSRKGYTLDASYHPVAHYLFNINFMLDFEHIVELER